MVTEELISAGKIGNIWKQPAEEGRHSRKQPESESSTIGVRPNLPCRKNLTRQRVAESHLGLAANAQSSTT